MHTAPDLAPGFQPGGAGQVGPWLRRLVHVDPSLGKGHGHHLFYARRLLQAAEHEGVEPVLVTHVDFDTRQVPEGWRVLPLFPKSTYTTLSWIGRRRRLAYGIGKLWRLPPGPRRRRRIKAFVAACVSMEAALGVRPGDLYFFPMMSDLEILGLGRYLETSPATRAARWALHFQFPLLEGHQAEQRRQGRRMRAVRRRFRTAFTQARGHRLALFAQTDAMREQYAELGLAPVRTLPWPSDMGLHPARSARSPKPELAPLRVAVLGGLRKEKGTSLLERIVEDLWDDVLAPGRMQLLVQSDDPDVRLSAREDPGAVVSRWPAGPLPDAPVAYTHYPLDPVRYRELVGLVDAALLPYESTRYHARFSAVLADMFAAGVPSVVTAGTWLAQQLDVPRAAHVERVGSRAPVIATHDHGDAVCARRTVDLGDVAVPQDAVAACVRFRWEDPRGIEGFVRVEAHDADGPLGADVVGRAANGEPARVLIPFGLRGRSPPSRLQVRARNAFDARRLRLGALRVDVLGGAPVPSAAVGLSGDGARELADRLRELLVHREHYRDSAAAFAARWVEAHNPPRVLEMLGRERSWS